MSMRRRHLPVLSAYQSVRFGIWQGFLKLHGSGRPRLHKFCALKLRSTPTHPSGWVRDAFGVALKVVDATSPSLLDLFQGVRARE